MFAVIALKCLLVHLFNLLSKNLFAYFAVKSAATFTVCFYENLF